MTAPLAAWFTVEGRRTRIRRVGGAVAVLAAAALLASPWWITVLLRHGIRPFLAAAASTTGSLTDLLRWLAVFPATAEPGLGVLAVLGVLGILGLAATGRPLALLWLLVLVVTVPRNSATPITIPLALGVAASLDALATAFTGRRERAARAKGAGSAAVVLLAGWALGYAFLENRMLLERADDVLPVLDTGERELAAWIEAHTPPDARFLIVTSAAEGEPDPFSEWFPALAGRVSILTPQGLEWTGGYNDRAALAARFQACVPEGAACIERLGRALPSFTHVLVCTQDRGSHGVLRMLGELVRSPAFERVHATPAGVVLARRPAD